MKKEKKMAEGTYEYECERAELLGIEKPDRRTWEKNQKERYDQMTEQQEIAEDAVSLNLILLYFWIC